MKGITIALFILIGFIIGYAVKTNNTQYMIDSAQALQEKAYDLGYDVGLNSCAD